jgi:uncharacterized protein (DUF1330 family)
MSINLGMASLSGNLGRAKPRSGAPTIQSEVISMPAYWVARSKINDPVEYKKYTDRLPPLFARYGAKILARGGRYQRMEGPDKFHRFIVIEFPTFDQAVQCFNSPEYQEAAAFRRGGAGEVETIIVEGGDATK